MLQWRKCFSLCWCCSYAIKTPVTICCLVSEVPSWRDDARLFGDIAVVNWTICRYSWKCNTWEYFAKLPEYFVKFHFRVNSILCYSNNCDEEKKSSLTFGICHATCNFRMDDTQILFKMWLGLRALQRICWLPSCNCSSFKIQQTCPKVVVWFGCLAIPSKNTYVAMLLHYVLSCVISFIKKWKI